MSYSSPFDLSIGRKYWLQQDGLELELTATYVFKLDAVHRGPYAVFKVDLAKWPVPFGEIVEQPLWVACSPYSHSDLLAGMPDLGQGGAAIWLYVLKSSPKPQSVLGDSDFINLGRGWIDYAERRSKS